MQLEWERVAAAVQARIARGELRPGDKLPAEKDLAEQYQVAYGTVRRAMKDLRDRGLIQTRWGKGTYVAVPASPPAKDD